MSTPDQSQERNQEENERKKYTQEDLEIRMRDAIRKYVQEEYASTVTKRETLKKIIMEDPAALGNFSWDIKRKMWHQFRDAKTYAGFEAALDNATKENILRAHAREILEERKDSEQMMISKLKLWFDSSVITKNIDSLNAVIKELSVAEISTALSSSRNLKQVLVNKNSTTSSLNIPNFDNFFKPKDFNDFVNELLAISANNADLKDLFNNDEDFRWSIQVFLLTGHFEESQFEKFLTIRWIDINDKKKIIVKFFPTLTHEQVKKHSLFPASEIQAKEEEIRNKISQEFTWKKFTDLSDAQKDEIGYLVEKYLQNFEYKTEDIAAATLNLRLSFTPEFQKELADIFKEQNKVYTEHIEQQKNTIKDLDSMKLFLKDNLLPDSKARIGGDAGIDDIVEGKIIKQEIVNTMQKGFWKIVNDNNDGWKGIRIQEYKIESTGVGLFEWTPKNHYAFTYREFAENIMDRLNDKDAHITLQDDVDAIEHQDLMDAIELEDVKKSLDALDDANEKKGFEEGMTFSVIVRNNGKKWREMVTVQSIDEVNKKTKIMLFDGQVMEMSFADFVFALDHEEMEPRRLGKTTSLEDFAINAGIINGDEVKNIVGLKEHDGRLVQKDKLDENTVYDVWGFQGDRSFIKVDFKPNGKVDAVLTEFKSNKEWEADLIEENERKDPSEQEDIEEKYTDDAIRAAWWKNKKKIEKLEKAAKQIKKGGKTFSNISYTHLLQIMQQTKTAEPAVSQEVIRGDGKTVQMDPVQAYEEKMKVENGEYMEDKEQPFIRFVTPAEIIFGAKHIYEYYKKKFDHKAEVRSAYAFMRINKFTGASAISAMSKLINGTKDDWKERFKGKAMRNHIVNVIFEWNPQPHETLAALMITIEMWGHLYPDSGLSDQQDNTYKWFNKVCHAIGVDPKPAFQKCFSKVVGEDKETRHHPAEEKLIERLFKLNQENNMVQALGGGAPFWKAADNTKAEQEKKWEAEADDIPNAKDRIQYAYSKMYSNEFEITAGAIPKIMEKTTDLEAFGPFFVIAASNAPYYVNSKTLDRFQVFRYKGYSFHGVGFCKNKANSEIYRDVIAIAIRKKFGADSEIYRKYAEIQKMVNATGYKHKEDIFKDLALFWKKYHKELHPVLQLTDPTLLMAIEDADTPSDDKYKLEKYMEIMGEAGEYYTGSGGIKQFKDFNNGNNTFGVKNNHVFLQKVGKNGKKIPYRSISLQLDALEIDGYTKAMSGASRNIVFQRQIIDFFKELRDSEVYNQNPEYQRKQFTIIYTELMDKLTEKTSTLNREDYEKAKNTDTLKHLTLLENQLGFNCSYDHMTIKDTKPGYKYEQDVTDEFFQKFLASRGNKSGSQNTAIRSRISKQVFDLAFTDSTNDDEAHKVA